MLSKVQKQLQVLLLLSALLQLCAALNNTPGGDIIQCVDEEEFEQMKGTLENNSLSLARLEAQFSDRFTQFSDQLSNVQGQLSDLQSQLAELVPIMSRFPNGSFQNPASSCKNVDHSSPSGMYWIHSTRDRNATQVYCNMTRQCCGSRGGWMRVAHLDMTDHNQQCPSGFRLITSPRRMCGRSSSTGSCVSTTFPVHGVEYIKVCGSVTGYQDGSPNAFNSYYHNRATTIDGVYVDGVSITHGTSPRKHIWTFAAVWDSSQSGSGACPCTRRDVTFTGIVPPYIEQNYFCETSTDASEPLWNGRGCGSRSTCCSFNSPPWFCKELPRPTTDNIELRLCGNQGTNNEDTPLKIIELYVQ